MNVNPYILLAVVAVLCLGVLAGVSVATGQGPLAGVQKASVPTPVAQNVAPAPQFVPQAYGGCGT